MAEAAVRVDADPVEALVSAFLRAEAAAEGDDDGEGGEGTGAHPGRAAAARAQCEQVVETYSWLCQRLCRVVAAADDVIGAAAVADTMLRNRHARSDGASLAPVADAEEEVRRAGERWAQIALGAEEQSDAASPVASRAGGDPAARRRGSASRLTRQPAPAPARPNLARVVPGAAAASEQPSAGPPRLSGRAIASGASGLRAPVTLPAATGALLRSEAPTPVAGADDDASSWRSGRAGSPSQGAGSAPFPTAAPVPAPAAPRAESGGRIVVAADGTVRLAGGGRGLGGGAPRPGGQAAGPGATARASLSTARRRPRPQMPAQAAPPSVGAASAAGAAPAAAAATPSDGAGAAPLASTAAYLRETRRSLEAAMLKLRPVEAALGTAEQAAGRHGSGRRSDAGSASPGEPAPAGPPPGSASPAPALPPVSDDAEASATGRRAADGNAGSLVAGADAAPVPTAASDGAGSAAGASRGGTATGTGAAASAGAEAGGAGAGSPAGHAGRRGSAPAASRPASLLVATSVEQRPRSQEAPDAADAVSPAAEPAGPDRQSTTDHEATPSPGRGGAAARDTALDDPVAGRCSPAPSGGGRGLGITTPAPRGPVLGPGHEGLPLPAHLTPAAATATPGSPLAAPTRPASPDAVVAAPGARATVSALVTPRQDGFSRPPPLSLGRESPGAGNGSVAASLPIDPAVELARVLLDQQERAARDHAWFEARIAEAPDGRAAEALRAKAAEAAADSRQVIARVSRAAAAAAVRQDPSIVSATKWPTEPGHPLSVGRRTPVPSVASDAGGSDAASASGRGFAFAPAPAAGPASGQPKVRRGLGHAGRRRLPPSALAVRPAASGSAVAGAAAASPRTPPGGGGLPAFAASAVAVGASPAASFIPSDRIRQRLRGAPVLPVLDPDSPAGHGDPAGREDVTAGTGAGTLGADADDVTAGGGGEPAWQPSSWTPGQDAGSAGGAGTGAHSPPLAVEELQSEGPGHGGAAWGLGLEPGAADQAAAWPSAAHAPPPRPPSRAWRDDAGRGGAVGVEGPGRVAGRPQLPSSSSSRRAGGGAPRPATAAGGHGGRQPAAGEGADRRPVRRRGVPTRLLRETASFRHHREATQAASATASAHGVEGGDAPGAVRRRGKAEEAEARARLAQRRAKATDEAARRMERARAARPRQGGAAWDVDGQEAQPATARPGTGPGRRQGSGRPSRPGVTTRVLDGGWD